MKHIQQSLSEGVPAFTEEKFVRQDGTAIDVEVSVIPFSYAGAPAAQRFNNITERKYAEQELANLAKFPSENPNPVLRLSRGGIVLYANAPSGAILGMWGCVVGGSAPQFWRDLITEALASMKSKTVDIECDGKVYSMVVTPVAEQGYVNIYGYDITERQQAEKALQLSEAKFRSYIENAPLGLFIADRSGRYVEVNVAASEMLGYTESELLRLSIPDVLAPQSLEAGLQTFQKVVQEGFASAEFLFRQKDGTQFWSTVLATRLGEDRFMSYCQNITERKLAETEIRQRLNELELLYQSGLAFNQLLTPKAIAKKIIDLLDQEMNWHHTAIRLYNLKSQTFDLMAFNLSHQNSGKDRKTEEERLNLIQRTGQGLCGWVHQHGQVVRSNDLKNDPRYLETFPDLKSGLYVPIKNAKGAIGVISIESEQAHAFSESDERLASTLAGQAAIALENTSLFNDLQRSNSELMLAYETTLEGWSRALDLRDKETEGHTQRVTEMTVNLARNFGLSEAELVDVRRGGLLHDIGKMGVPDHILLKPGELTAEERKLMRMHPVYAYDLLSHIAYLHTALDIPYCHHEKWDGSGYPRGLKGDQIPLVARIFAVVDVWDALTSDRPYRPAWTKEKAREHIRALSGTHFDPKIVELFLKLDLETKELSNNEK